MARSQTILIAGAGIGGLACALSLATKGFRVVVLERNERLEEAGAGLQLSPNASSILVALGLRDALTPYVVSPDAIRIHSATGGDIGRIPLGPAAAFRYGAPYWAIHRADLQRVLLDAVSARPEIKIRLGARVDDFACHARGVTVRAEGPHNEDLDEHGLALIGADGLWSTIRGKLGFTRPPRFAGRTAWRAVVPAEAVDPEFREPATHLWLGRRAHLVHYPLQAGRVVNLVALVTDRWNEQGWSAPGRRDELIARFADWDAKARALLATPEHWLKWALFDRPPLRRWGSGPVTLLGDAAHPMLPFLAQGAAMSIEDGAVLAECLARAPGDPDTALRTYEGLRRQRTARVQLEARRNDLTYHLAGPAALARNMALSLMGGEKLLTRYDWLYDWRVPNGG